MEESKGSIFAKCSFGILIAFFLFIQSTIQHYVGDLDECTLSKICNHTWTPICGHNVPGSNYRLFLDKCDLHEYNCENNKSYVETDVKVCSQKCTKNGHQNKIATTSMSSTTAPTTKLKTTTVKSSTTKPTTKKTEVSIMTTEDVTETTTDKTDTPTIFIETTTTIETTTETTSQSPESTTKATETTTEVTTVEPLTEKNTIEDKNTIPQETISLTTTPKPNLSPCYPNHCSAPSTWETTAAGETRDFVQIIRERYGDRVKFLRHTTHFPKEANYVRRSESFIPGRHVERR